MKTKLLVIILIPLFIGCGLFKKNDTVIVEEEAVEEMVIDIDKTAEAEEEVVEEEVVEEEVPSTTYQPGDEIFQVVETPPKFVGGDEARIKFLQNNIHYPLKAREVGISGTVFATFVVEKMEVYLMLKFFAVLEEAAMKR